MEFVYSECYQIWVHHPYLWQQNVWQRQNLAQSEPLLVHTLWHTYLIDLPHDFLS